MTEGSDQFKLMNMSQVTQKAGAFAAARARTAAYEKYQAERRALYAAGKSKEEVFALGYGMNYSEWCKKYNAEMEKKNEEREDKIKEAADAMAPDANEDLMTVKEDIMAQEKVYSSQGISLVSEAQWVPIQEAHNMEQKIINNSQGLAGVIEGLTVMGNNLDTAKNQLSLSISELRKHPVVNVIPVQGPSPANAIAKAAEGAGTQTMVTEHEEVFLSGDVQIYDPLPAI